MKNKLVLASASPRRLDLLRQIHIEPAKIQPADIDEEPHKGELPRQLAERLARQKAEAVHTQNFFTLGADTVVACGRRILPKAENAEEARDCLARLSGRRHHVYGGISLIAPNGTVRTRLCDTIVKFKTLSKTEIDTYIAGGEWQGKAGGYGIQGYAAAFVEFLRGDYSNVVGLSLYDTMRLLEGQGFWHGRTDSRHSD